MPLGKRALGVACGLVWGLIILLVTWLIVIKGTEGYTISKLQTFYLGYTSSFVGGIIGFLYGFVTGFIIGFLIAWIYNLVNNTLSKKKVA